MPSRYTFESSLCSFLFQLMNAAPRIVARENVFALRPSFHLQERRDSRPFFPSKKLIGVSNRFLAEFCGDASPQVKAIFFASLRGEGVTWSGLTIGIPLIRFLRPEVNGWYRGLKVIFKPDAIIVETRILFSFSKLSLKVLLRILKDVFTSSVLETVYTILNICQVFYLIFSLNYCKKPLNIRNLYFCVVFKPTSIFPF